MSAIVLFYMKYMDIALSLQTSLWPIRQVNGIWRRMVLGNVFLEFKRCREKFLKDNNTTTKAHQQRTIMTLSSSITPFLRVNIHKWGSQPWLKGVKIDEAIAHRSCLSITPLHRCHQQIKGIITKNQKYFPPFGYISILESEIPSMVKQLSALLMK